LILPRNASGVYSKPNADVVTQTVISSSEYNSTVNDLVADLNLDRPIAAGGTGASTASAARDNLGVAEKQSGTSDATEGRGLIVGAAGILGNAPVSTDWDAETKTKFLRTGAASTTGAPSTADVWHGLHVTRTTGAAHQMAVNPAAEDTRVRFQSGSTWSAWRKWWHAGNLLGTVSESSGVPTGAVLEEDDDGTTGYIRLAGGTQICHIRGVELVFGATSSVTAVVTLPKAYFSTQHFSASAILRPATETSSTATFAADATPDEDEILAPVCGNKGVTQVAIRVFRIKGGTNFSALDKLYVDVTTVGRWYA
jgi:hypothetical protein